MVFYNNNMSKKREHEFLSLGEVAEIFGLSIQAFKERLIKIGFPIEEFRNERGSYEIPIYTFRRFLEDPGLPDIPSLAIFLGNNKGGVGKTTVTFLLALVLGPVMGFKVVILDLDYQSFTMTKIILGEEEASLSSFPASLLQVVNQPDIWEQAVLPSSWDNLWLIPARSESLQWENILAILPKITTLIKNLKTRFDIILMDPPPMKTDFIDAAIFGADAAVGITQPHNLAFSQLVDILISIQQVNSLRNSMSYGENGFSPIVFPGIIVNMFSKRHTIDRISLEYLEHLWEDPVFSQNRPQLSFPKPVIPPPIPRLTFFKEIPLSARHFPVKSLLSRVDSIYSLTASLLRRIRKLQTKGGEK